MSRPFYFGAGPAHLPDEVLLEIQSEFMNWQGTQLSILETGHRTPQFENRMQELEALFRSLLDIPVHYEVLFMGLPSRAHFGLIPLHFLSDQQQAGYWVTGHWSNLAYQEALKLKQAYCIAHVSDATLKQIPDVNAWCMKEDTAYAYLTPNETLEGIRFTPDLTQIPCPVIADMTSCLLTEAIRVEDYSMILAGSQKNFGCAGLGVIIIAQDFLDKANAKSIPTFLDYRTYARNHSLCVTPPTFNCEVTFKMLKWMEAQGGLLALEKQNKQKAAEIYHYIDSTDFYQNFVDKSARSPVNVTFHLQNKDLESRFFAEAKENGLIGLEGHRLQGGVRVGLYNAVPLEGVGHLITFMKTFENRYG